ncbi:hypothetical protein OJAV_G00171650 [Oryzias javanicus]|uniref:Uncharacterized protein n=1 Tax=Oryzias javanicus TaxID=123683 RepID=A0A3S2U2X8_ORYJA|nr:hypothetical protein OJAV_G00171650 [Oryzias javanicus]
MLYASFLDPSRSFPPNFLLISKCFILDEGICLWRKGLRCPVGGGVGLFGVLLPICRCTRSVVSASRPEEPSPAGPGERQRTSEPQTLGSWP